MEVELNEYEKEKFEKLDKMPWFELFKINQDRVDLKEFMVALDKYHQTWNCVQYSQDNKAFKLNYPERVRWYCAINQLSI